MKFHEGRFPCGIDEPKGVDAESFHEAERAGNRPVRHDPHHHMHAFRRQGDEIPEVVVGRLGLRESSIRFRFGRMDQIGKLDGVLNKEHRNVIPDNVPIAFLRVKLYSEAANISRQVCRAFTAGDGREPHEGGGLLARALEDVGLGNVGERLVVLEVAMSAKAAGMDDPLRYALVIEVKNLFAKVKVFQRRRTALADPKRVLIVGYRSTLLCGQHRRVTAGRLVRFSSRTGRYILVGVLRRFTIVGVALGLVTGCAFLGHFYFLLKDLFVCVRDTRSDKRTAVDVRLFRTFE